MKIFNWMNRRLRQNDRSPTISAHKDKYLSNNYETQDLFETLSLLEHGGDVVTAPADMFETQKLAGFLAIGTLGIDPLKDGMHAPMEKAGDEALAVEEEEELCDLQYSADADHDVENAPPPPPPPAVILGGNDEIEIVPLILLNEGCSDEGPRPWNIEPKCNKMNIVVDREILGSDEKGKKKAKRVTLADLFLADPHHHQHHHLKTQSDPEADHVVVVRAKKPPPSDRQAKKERLPKAKKKLLNPHSLNEYLKHFKRMMKKKIHPDFHGKFQINEEAPMNVAETPASNQADGADEGGPMLPIHDGIVVV